MRERVIPLFILIGCFVVAGIIIGIYPKTILVVGTALGGWLGVVLQVLYNRWDRLYLFAQYIRSFFYPDTSWDFTVEFFVNDDISASFENLQSRMADSISDAKLKLNSPTLIEFRWHGLVGQIMVHETGQYQLHLLDVQVSKWKTDAMMNGQIQQIFDVIESWMKPDRKRYFFTVRFDGNNPYFGLYLRRLGKAEVINFDVTIAVDNNKVELHKDHLTIVAPSFGEIRSLSKKYLLLSVTSSF